MFRPEPPPLVKENDGRSGDSRRRKRKRSQVVAESTIGGLWKEAQGASDEGAKSLMQLQQLAKEHPFALSVNDTTAELAPLAPVKGLGNVLGRVVDFMAQVPKDEVVMFSKIDLSDGFWRMIVSDEQKWNFAYVLPDIPGAPTRLVIPSALQMGWAQSPGFFCAATETGRDIISDLLKKGTDLPPHSLEAYMAPERPAKRQKNRHSN